jgi:hypothetical protein
VVPGQVRGSHPQQVAQRLKSHLYMLQLLEPLSSCRERKFTLQIDDEFCSQIFCLLPTWS